MSLGKHIATFRPSPAIRTGLIGVIMATPVIVFLATRQILEMAVVISIMWLVFVAYIVRRNLWKPAQIEVYEHGMMFDGEPWKWALFSAIHRVDEDKTLILYQGNIPVFNLPLVKNRDQLFDLIVDSVEPIVYKRIKARLEEGKSIHYADLSILPDGLEIRNRVVKWADIQAMDTTPHSIILDVGETLTINTSQMQNAHVVERIIREQL